MINTPHVKLEAKGICKSFPGVKALQQVNFDLLKGEVHVLCGENGAGKSTLMHILSGNLQPDKGSIFLNMEQAVIETPRQALEKGIAIVYQERSLTEELSVAENIYANRQPTNKMGWIVFRKMFNLTRELLNRLSLHNISPTTKVKNLSAAQKQMVEIAKALSVHPSILILDEPTASITETETQLLFNIIRHLKSEGVSIIYISHRMKELFEIGDRITVLKDGRFQGTYPVKEATQELLIRKMTGRNIHAQMTSSIPEKNVVLEVKHLSGKAFSNISFQLHQGEILALSGLAGAGRTEIARAIFGADPRYGGSCLINGKHTSVRHPFNAIMQGIGYIPEERKEKGLFMQMSVKENILSIRTALSSKANTTTKSHQKIIADLIRQLAINPSNPERRVINLSGGNQQKVVIARWLLMNPKILIADEPTHGIDVGAKFEIYQLLQKLAKEGTGILLISSELPEVLTLAHRILVLHNGQITANLAKEEATEEDIMYYASGIKNMYTGL